MTTIQELRSAIDRFKSLKQHRDLVEMQYEKVREELARRFDELDLTEIKHGEERIVRTFYRIYRYDIPLLQKELNPKTFESISYTKTVIVGQKLREAVKLGEINAGLADRVTFVEKQTDVIKILSQ